MKARKKRSQRIRGARSIPEGSIYERFQTSERKEPKTHAYPTNIIKFNLEQNNQHSKKVFHPTQKPVALLEYLIKTYSNPGDTVLDFTMGSGSTGVAAILNDRNFIGFEIEEDFFNVAKERLAEACSQVPIGPSDQTI